MLDHLVAVDALVLGTAPERPEGGRRSGA